MLKEYKCVECGETCPTEFYGTNKSLCKHCKNKRDNITQRDRRREYQAKYYPKWYAEHGRKRAENYMDIILIWGKNHLKERAISKRIRRLIKVGKLDKPLNCSMCGKAGRINAHHDDYNIPFEIRWVCSSCHKKIHLGLIE